MPRRLLRGPQDEREEALVGWVEGGRVGFMDPVGFLRPERRHRGQRRLPTPDLGDPLRGHQAGPLHFHIGRQLPLLLLGYAQRRFRLRLFLNNPQQFPA